jgi:hypothetical protein
MLLKNRLFTQPDRSAQKIYIFCEGKDREYNYFKFFAGIDTRLNLIIYELKGDEDNSPKGLYNLATNCLIKSDTNLNPIYDYRETDIVWIVLDTDKDKKESRKEQLIDIRIKCNSERWNIAQSNPCFEVWLYYHQESNIPEFENIEIPSNWKKLVNNIISGGFDSRKHPVFIETAIKNSEKHFQVDENNFPYIATTEVFKLAQNILATGKIKEKINSGLKEIK